MDALRVERWCQEARSEHPADRMTSARGYHASWRLCAGDVRALRRARASGMDAPMALAALRALIHQEPRSRGSWITRKYAAKFAIDVDAYEDEVLVGRVWAAARAVYGHPAFPHDPDRWGETRAALTGVP